MNHKNIVSSSHMYLFLKSFEFNLIPNEVNIAPMNDENAAVKKKQAMSDWKIVIGEDIMCSMLQQTLPTVLAINYSIAFTKISLIILVFSLCLYEKLSLYKVIQYYIITDRILIMYQEDLKPSFRSTRSRFFRKKQSETSNLDDSPAEENTGDYWKKKGNQSLSKGKIQQSIEYYSKAIEINPGQSIYFSNRSQCFKRLGKIQAALKDAEEACQLDQMNIKAHYLCGCLQAELAKNDHSKINKAINRLKKALRLCSTLKKKEFLDEISIKLFRARKLSCLIEEETRKQFIAIQESLMKELTNKKIVQADKIQKLKNYIDLLKAQEKVQKQIPGHISCKITLQIMEDPVTTEAGFTYQKSAIQDHFQKNGYFDPLTRKPISPKLYSNQALKAAIHNFLEQHPWGFQFVSGESYRQIEF